MANNALTLTRSGAARNAGQVVFKTPQELIHIRHGITLVQYKYWLLMLRAYHEECEKFGAPPEGEMVYLARSTLEGILGYQPKTSDIENDFERIRKEPMRINLLEKDGTPAKMGIGFINEWFVSGARIGVVFPTAIKRAMENLSNSKSIFQLLNWPIFNSFNGKYEAVIYKLAKDYVNIGTTPFLSLELFRQYIGLADGEYSDFKELNRRAIADPIKKINNSELSDIVINVEFRKSQKRVEAIRFIVDKKNQVNLDFGDSPAFDKAKTPISKVLQAKYLDGRDQHIISAAIDRANIYGEIQEKAGNPVNYSALYRRAIEDGWGEEALQKQAKAAADAEASPKVQRPDAGPEEKNRVDEARKAEMKADYLNYATTQMVNKMEIEQRIALSKEFRPIAIDENDFNAGTGWFVDKLDNMKFKVFLRSKVSPQCDEEAFQKWVKLSKNKGPHA
jgi:hypothetical protein